ncbi:MAG: DNA gyrase subunit A [Trueperaceae bacterium]|nr:DNA gyrase subunit A [Trueperaceae bacterium]MCH2667524.1 DNA gyrase subunit A [Deinococcales bacterium]
MNEGHVVPVQITDEIKSSFINYAMSVIVDRALPDVRDGLKPVQRRILYAMQQEGLFSNRKHSKSAGVVGEVIKKYHPHSDASIYDAMVRLAQDWNLRYPLVDGQGNFGSIDGDPPAAYRYTEARLSALGESMLVDIDKEVVEEKPNFDDTTVEPEVLPSALPNLLINGASGIAVGMATNIAPHNLSEIIDGLIAMIDQPTIDLDGLMEYIQGPDFPTGGVMSREGIRQAFETGRGGIRVRGRVRIEERNNRNSIIVSEIPYQINKTSLIQTAAGLVRTKKIDDISNIRDESDRQGMRIVFELKRGAHPELVLNQLYKYTQLQSTFSINNVAIVDKSPRILALPETLRLFLDHRADVVKRRSQFELRKAQERAHVLEGYLIALDQLDEVIELIRNSPDPTTARAGLITEFNLSEIQAQAVLDMRLQRLTGLERERLQEEYRGLQEEISRLETILGKKEELWKVIKEELQNINERFGNGRKTQIADLSEDISKEDLIAEENMVVTVTRGGYIKRTAMASYRAQNRGGRGVSSQRQKEDDINSLLLVGSTHDYLLFFTDRGRVYREKIYDLPEAERNARGNHLRNLLPLEGEEQVETVLSLKSFDVDGYFLFSTRQGIIKRTAIRDYANINAAGLIAINLVASDELVSVSISNGNADVVLATREGRSIRFEEGQVRETGRATQGVIGIRLRKDDYVVSLVVIPEEAKTEAELLTVSEAGFGKRTLLGEYPVQNRGGMGVITMKVTERTGSLVSLGQVTGEEELFVLSEGGVLIRTRVSEVSNYGRSSQGVTIMRLDEGDQAVATMVMLPDDKLEEALLELESEVGLQQGGTTN